ncbi:hypothetical protein ACFE04_028040 [Oxalis oulophora]
MIIKFTFLSISKQIPSRVIKKSFLSSCTSNYYNLLKKPDTDHESQTTTGFDSKVQTLRKNLCPSSLIHVLDSTHDLASAVRIFKWAAIQKQFNHTVDTYYWMILKLGLAGNVNEMEGFCINMVKDKCLGVEQAFVSLIREFVMHCRVNEAVRVFKQMSLGGFKGSVDLCNVLLGALVKNKHDLKDVLYVYKEMVKSGVLPTVDTLNYLLEVLFDSGNVESVLDQFRRMAKKGCKPNSRTFEIVITGLIENNRVDDSVLIFHEMFGLGCKPELSFHNFVIPHFCKLNNIEDIIRLFKMSRDSNFVLDSLVYEELIGCLCSNNRLDDANMILEEMMEDGITPAVDVFVDLVRGFCEVGKFDEALNVLEEKADDMVSPFNALLEGYCKADKIFKAKSLLDSLSERGLADRNSWNVLITWVCENVGIHKANELLAKMIISSKPPDSATYSALIIGNCKLGNYESAVELFHQVPTKSLVLDSLPYSIVMRVLFQSKILRGLFIVFSRLLVEGYSIDVEEYCTLIQSTIAENRIRDCALFFNLMIGEGLLPDSETMRVLLSYLASHSKLHTILIAVDKLMNRNEILNSSMCNLLINGFWKEGCETEARRILDFMLEKGWVPDSTTHQRDWETLEKMPLAPRDLIGQDFHWVCLVICLMASTAQQERSAPKGKENPHTLIGYSHIVANASLFKVGQKCGCCADAHTEVAKRSTKSYIYLGIECLIKLLMQQLRNEALIHLGTQICREDPSPTKHDDIFNPRLCVY